MGRSILVTLMWGTLVLSALALAAWALGQAVTDSLGWSQFLYWIPTPVALGASGSGLLGSAVLGVWLRRGERGTSEVRSRGPARIARCLMFVAWCGALIFMLVHEWHVQRGLVGGGSPTSQHPVKVLFWNPSVLTLASLPEELHAQHADVAIIANAPWQTDWVKIRAAFGEPNFTLRADRFTVISSFPITRSASTNLGIRGSRPRVAHWMGEGNIGIDEGEALFFEVQTGSVWGRTTSIWVLDLPSDAHLLRRDVLHQAAAAIAAFPGPILERIGLGMDQAQQGAGPGFPRGDIVVGDFNTPRGSASLGQIAGDLHDVFDEAGHGFAATWPRKLPMLAIDQAFIAPWLRATGYEVVDMGEGEHRAEVFGLVSKDSP